MQLGELVFEQSNQFIILLDGFERLDKNRLPAGTRSVHHARYTALVLRLDRNDEAFAAYRDNFFLRSAVLTKPPQVGLQRLLYGAPLLFDLTPNARQFRRRSVVECAV